MFRLASSLEAQVNPRSRSSAHSTQISFHALSQNGVQIKMLKLNPVVVERSSGWCFVEN